MSSALFDSKSEYHSDECESVILELTNSLEKPRRD